jgi:hypothetical protein
MRVLDEIPKHFVRVDMSGRKLFFIPLVVLFWSLGFLHIQRVGLVLGVFIRVLASVRMRVLLVPSA